MPLKALPPPPAFTWTGIYGGGYIGGMWAKTDNDFVFAPPASWQQSASVGIAGGIVGIQYQWGNLVLGVEGNAGGALSRQPGNGVMQSRHRLRSRERQFQRRLPTRYLVPADALVGHSAIGCPTFPAATQMPLPSSRPFSLQQPRKLAGRRPMAHISEGASIMRSGAADWSLASNIATTIFRRSRSNHSTRPAPAFCSIRIIPDPSSIHSLFGRPICSARSEERLRSGFLALPGWRKLWRPRGTLCAVAMYSQ